MALKLFSVKTSLIKHGLLLLELLLESWSELQKSEGFKHYLGKEMASMALMSFHVTEIVTCRRVFRDANNVLRWHLK